MWHKKSSRDHHRSRSPQYSAPRHLNEDHERHRDCRDERSSSSHRRERSEYRESSSSRSKHDDYESRNHDPAAAKHDRRRRSRSYSRSPSPRELKNHYHDNRDKRHQESSYSRSPTPSHSSSMTPSYLLHDKNTHASLRKDTSKDCLGQRRDIDERDYHDGSSTRRDRPCNNQLQRVHKQETSKSSFPDHATSNDISQVPTNYLLIRGLDPTVEERTILELIGPNSTVNAIKSIKILKDARKQSRGLCLIELYSFRESYDLYNSLVHMSPPFKVNGNSVIISYGLNNDANLNMLPKEENSVNKSSTAVCAAALAAAQWTNHFTNKSPVIAADRENEQHRQTTVQANKFVQTPATISAPTSITSSACSSISASPVIFSAPPRIIDRYQSQATTSGVSKMESTKWEIEDDDESSLKKNETVVNSFSLEKNQTFCPKQRKTESSGTSPKNESLSTNGKQKDDKISSQSIEQMKNIVKTEEEKYVSFELLACLLCKRTFKNKELLGKHCKLSDLHKSSVEELRRSLFSQEQIDEVERLERERERERESMYRDRARERREKYGIAASVDVPENPLKTKYLKSANPSAVALISKLANSTCQAPLASGSSCGTVTTDSDRPIESDNIGAKLLSKMGWKEGLGIGKANQGMTDIIKVEQRHKNAGLGTAAKKSLSNLSYKDAVRLTMYERYRELSEENN